MSFTTDTVLARFFLNNGTTETLAFSSVEKAILAYRKARKARRVLDRAFAYAYSLDGGTTWLK